jgi:ribosomal protein S19E (S16A)
MSPRSTAVYYYSVGHILRRSHLLKQITVGKLAETTALKARRGRSCKQLLISINCSGSIMAYTDDIC